MGHAELVDVLKTVTGNGLLQAVHLQPSIPMFGGNQKGTPSFLSQCRKGSFCFFLILLNLFSMLFSAGIGIINAAHTVKFTSHFELTSKEVDLLVSALHRVCANYKLH